MPFSPLTHRIAEMTWPEVETAARQAPLAIVPTGSCEQHGRHLALATDTVRAEEFADRLAQRLSPRAVVTPCLTVGVSPHHMAFPGTLTLSPHTFGQVLYEVVESLYSHGWRYVYILNGHGGNNQATGATVSRLQAALAGLRIAWSGITPVVADIGRSIATGPGASHASEVETAQVLYLAPRLVRERFLDRGEADSPAVERYRRVSAPGGVHAPLPFDRVSADGSTGNPWDATRAGGETLIETALDRVSSFLKEFLDHEEDPAHATRR